MRDYAYEKPLKIEFVQHNMAPLMFGGLIGFMLIAIRLPSRRGRRRHDVRYAAIAKGLFCAGLLRNMTYQLFGIISNDLLLSIPFFTLMRDSRALRPR